MPTWFLNNVSRSLALLALLAVAGAPLQAQPDFTVEPDLLAFRVESRLTAVDTLYITNESDMPLTVSIEVEIGDFPTRQGRSQERQAPSLSERDLRLSGTFSAPLERLLEETSRGASVRVLVHLDVPFAPEGYLSAGEVTAQRAEIQGQQAALLQSLAPFQAELLYQYRYVPLLALEVDAAALNHLVGSLAVVRIQEDELAAPDLEESVEIVGAPEVWDLGFAGEDWAAAILDTGVDNDHPFLEGKVVAEACFSSGSGSLCPGGTSPEIGPESGDDACEQGANITGCDHGTHVAGIAAGSTDGFHGVARDGNIIALQVFHRVDSQAQCGSNPAPCVLAFSSDIVAALEHVYDLAIGDEINVASANMSLGGGFFTSPCPSDSREQISAQLTSVGVAVVSSSGNGGRSNGMGAPACAPSVLSVASTDDGSFGTIVDNVSSFSDVVSFTDFFAPGNRIRSSVPGGQYANFLGTSMAAPHVAGAYAILKSANPEASVEESTGALKISGIPITDDRNGVTLPRIQIDYAMAALNWLGVSTETVEIAPGETVAVPVVANALGLVPGEYEGTVLVGTGVLGETVAVPVELTVDPVALVPIEVASRNPDEGVFVGLNPVDADGEGNGQTPLTRVYPRGTNVTFIAIPSVDGNEFGYWQAEGQIYLDRIITVPISESALWTVTYLLPDNAPPVANPDTAYTPQGQGVEIDVLANDSDPEGDALVVAGLSGMIHGTADILENQNVDYVPNPDFVGVDTFTYYVADEFGAIAPATVTVFVGQDVGTEDGAGLPAAFALGGNYPNPFSGATTLRVDLPEAASVSVVVYDLLGREVLRLAERSVPAGAGRTVAVDAGGLPAGVYFYRLEANTAREQHVGTGRFAVIR